MILNVGIQFTEITKIIDGFKTTFAVNYLAHYLLIRILFDNLAHRAKILLTTSGTYDPTENTIIPPPKHADAQLLGNTLLDPERMQMQK